MKKAFNYIIIILLILIICFSLINKDRHYVVTALGTVLEKNYDVQYTIKFKKSKVKKGEKEIYNIIIEDRKVWNLIKVGEKYFVSFSWKKDEMPVLEQIEFIDD